MDLYKSLLGELEEDHVIYIQENVVTNYHYYLMRMKTDNIVEFGYLDKQLIHNLK